MSSPTPDSPEVNPPNEAIAHLIHALDLEDTVQVIHTYLREFEREIGHIAATDRITQQRLAHSLKSSSAQMGAHDLSRRLAEIETRLPAGGPSISPEEAADIAAEFQRTAGPLREFAARHPAA
jgi:HPt (histidine-containing phosphotransfer) domain-containing protein